MSPTLIRNHRIETDDWIRIADEQPVPDTGRVIVSLERWQAERAALLARAGETGVAVANTVDAQDLFEELPHWQLIALDFPSFTDGRAYSQARLLRTRGGYTCELRATGDVLRDQLFYMDRCGFDALELAPGRDANAALAAFEDFKHPYQPSVSGGQSMFRQRATAR